MRKAKEDAKRVMENARREADAIIAELKTIKKQAAQTPETRGTGAEKAKGEGHRRFERSCFYICAKRISSRLRTCAWASRWKS